jgi:hypothetical protein
LVFVKITWSYDWNSLKLWWFCVNITWFFIWFNCLRFICASW